MALGFSESTSPTTWCPSLSSTTSIGPAAHHPAPQRIPPRAAAATDTLPRMVVPLPPSNSLPIPVRPAVRRRQPRHCNLPPGPCNPTPSKGLGRLASSLDVGCVPETHHPDVARSPNTVRLGDAPYEEVAVIVGRVDRPR